MTWTYEAFRETLCQKAKKYLEDRNASTCVRNWDFKDPLTVVRVLHDASCYRPQCRLTKHIKHVGLSALMGLSVAAFATVDSDRQARNLMSGAALGTVAGLLTRDVAPEVIFHEESKQWMKSMREAIFRAYHQQYKIGTALSEALKSNGVEFEPAMFSDLKKLFVQIPDNFHDRPPLG